MNLGTASGSHGSKSTSIPTGASNWDYVMTCGSCLYTVFANEVGTYQYTDSNSGLNGSFTVTGSTSGVEENAEVKSELSVFPNPCSNNEISVNYSLPTNEGSVQLTNLAGQIIFSAAVQNKEGILTINQELEAGVYICTLLSEGTIVETKKLIIK